jgi:prepilin-type N-terminal cleavage/methylation domain-containing protein
MKTRTRLNFGRGGFTLVELLTVIAISAILMGLVMIPVVQSFKLTRRAEAMVDAQDSARHAMETISRELGEAVFVYDNTSYNVQIYDDGTTPAELRANGRGPLQLPVRQPDGSIQCFTLPDAKIDFVLPAMTMHCNNPLHPAGVGRDYDRNMDAWPPCPVCSASTDLDVKAGAWDVEVRPHTPLKQSNTIVRYFLGLRINDPNANDPTDGLFGWKSPWHGEVAVGEENQVVLYRAEFDVRDNTLFPAEMTIEQRLSDPIFFYRSAKNSQGVPFCKRWAEVVQVVGIGKYQDLVIAEYGPNGVVTSVEPTITFRFTAVDNDTFSGSYSSDKSFEEPNAVPTLFLGAYGYWTPSFSVTVYRNNYKTAYTYTLDEATHHHVIMKRVYLDDTKTWSDPVITFDVTDYERTGVIAGSGDPTEMAFLVDPTRGAVSFALRPPNKSGADCVSPLDPREINAAFDQTPGADRGNARRMALLATFDPSSPNYLPNAVIVPGSDKVVGPDMTPGPNYGKPIQYERVPLVLGDPGPNQYKIDWKTGNIFFTSVYNQPLPVTDKVDPLFIKVNYQVQFNRVDDVVRGDYATRSLVVIRLGMRMFDPESGKPHQVDLTNSVKVRNTMR